MLMTGRLDADSQLSSSGAVLCQRDDNSTTAGKESSRVELSSIDVFG